MNFFKKIIFPPLVLTLICAAIALMLGYVNAVTAGPIADAEAKAKEEAIRAIFPAAVDVTEEKLPGEIDSAVKVNAFYTVKDGSGFIGCAVNVTVGSGYGGEINMTVGVTPDGKVKGVEIVSHSETAGLGARIDEASFRQRFVGVTEYAEIGENVDAISGATISSKAVAAGVTAALGAAELFYENSPYGSAETELDTDITAFSGAFCAEVIL